MSGQCLRTWHFCAPILESGHEVMLMTVPIPGTTDEEKEPPMKEAVYQGFEYTRFLSNNPARIAPLINEIAEGFRPDAVVGVNAYPAYLLATINRPEPFWADLNGWTMAEGQVRASVVGHYKEFGHFWKQEALTAMRADKFSTVTQRQGNALYGELAVLGRLDQRNFSHNFISHVPNAVYPDYATLQRTAKMPEILGKQIPQDAAICLWSGGFNSWTNVDMLVDGIAKAIEQEGSLIFVCTGGAIHGHDTKTYERFNILAQRRIPAGRWFPLGWTDFGEVLDLHACAACGINIDGQNTETVFGARNRLTNMMGAGLPVITTRGTEIAEWIEENAHGMVIPQGDSDALAGAIVASVQQRELWQERAVRTREAALREFAARNTLTDFLAWIEEPAFAPDRGPGSVDPHGLTPIGVLREWVEDKAMEPSPFQPEIEEEPPLQHGSGQGLFGMLRNLTGGKH